MGLTCSMVLYNMCTLHVKVSSNRIFLAARSLWMNDLLARWFIPDAICLENRRNWISNVLEF